jgi:hypothetical protein
MNKTDAASVRVILEGHQAAGSHVDGRLWREVDQPGEMFLGTYANGPRNGGSVRRHVRQSHTDCSEIDKELSAKGNYEKTSKTEKRRRLHCSGSKRSAK